MKLQRLLPPLSAAAIVAASVAGQAQAPHSGPMPADGPGSESVREAALVQRLPPAARHLFPELGAAEHAFEQARGAGEYTVGSGPEAARLVALDQSRLREQFLIDLQRFAAGDLPSATPSERVRVEQEESVLSYNALGFTPDPAGPANQLTPHSLAFTEQQWQALYALWLRFIPVAYPQLSPDAAATELLRLRIHQLQHLDR